MSNTNTRQVPEGVKTLPEDKPWLAYVGKIEDTGEIRPWLWHHPRIIKGEGWDNLGGHGYAGGGGLYAIDTRHPEALEYFPEICEAHNASRPRIWEADIEMQEGDYEHFWRIYAEGVDVDTARNNALISCCHCDEDEIDWEDDCTVVCADSQNRYTVTDLREAPWRESL